MFLADITSVCKSADWFTQNKVQGIIKHTPTYLQYVARAWLWWHMYINILKIYVLVQPKITDIQIKGTKYLHCSTLISMTRDSSNIMLKSQQKDKIWTKYSLQTFLIHQYMMKIWEVMWSQFVGIDRSVPCIIWTLKSINVIKLRFIKSILTHLFFNYCKSDGI